MRAAQGVVLPCYVGALALGTTQFPCTASVIPIVGLLVMRAPKQITWHAVLYLSMCIAPQAVCTLGAIAAVHYCGHPLCAAPVCAALSVRTSGSPCLCSGCSQYLDHSRHACTCITGQPGTCTNAVRLLLVP